MSVNIKRATNYLKRNGIKKTVQLAYERVKNPYFGNYSYEPPNPRMLGEQCAHSVLDQGENPWKQKPIISLVVPAYETNVAYMRELLESVASQTYPYWQLIIADGSQSNIVEEVVKHFLTYHDTCISDLLGTVFATGISSDDMQQVKAAYEIGPKVKYIRLQENGGISQNSNQGLKYAIGKYVALLDHDDLLTPDALYEMVKKINEGYQMIYSDEDKCDENASVFFEPNIKPDFDLDYLLSNNYICHFLLIKTELVKNLGFRPEYDGAQDYDLILRCVAQIQDTEIGHVQKVLYHWRCHRESTADNPESKMYAYEAGRRAVQDYLDSRRILATVENTEHVGFYRIHYAADFFTSRPEIGVIGGSVLGRNQRVVSGNMQEDGNCILEGKPVYFSGPCNRASVVQQAYAVDARTMTLRPELTDLYEACMGIPYQPDLAKRDKQYCRQLSDAVWRQRSIALCQEIGKRNYKIIWDPSRQVKC